MKPILSIAVVTMNRAEQLKEALKSCLACELPKETEFVIIDNASTDNTEEVVKGLLGDCGFRYYYEKMPENLGVGKGRNYAYDNTNGDYVYVLDDDAVIDEKNKDFFNCAIKILEENPDIVSITTQAYDTAWKKYRMENKGKLIYGKLYKIMMFCGFSHFLRKGFFKDSPYLSNQYGYEEIPPSLYAIDAGKVNVFCPDLNIIHKPKVNKWDFSDEKNYKIILGECAIKYALKRMLYPRLFYPLLFCAYKRRCRKYLTHIDNYKSRAKELYNRVLRDYKLNKKIKVKTVIKMYKEFGVSVF